MGEPPSDKNVDERRLAELGALENLTDVEMRELIRLKPPGTFKKLPNVLTIGVIDLPQATANLKEGSVRSKHAYDSGCYIEVISLRLQHMDFWLRLFWVERNAHGRIFEPSDRRTFGAVVSDCAKIHFDPMLIERIRLFNTSRVDAIHKYLLGAIRYEDLKEVCDLHRGLDSDICTYVTKQIGIPWPG
jgi:hypothetical protein